MDRKIVFAFILTFIGVVNGACDRNAVTKCMEGNAKDSDTQCKVFLPALTTCIDTHRESCKGDAVLDNILPIEKGLITQCQQAGDCTLTSCMQATPYVTNLPQGQLPEASPEFCAAVTEQKTCVEMARATGKCQQSAIQQYDQMVNSFSVLCGGCSPQKMQVCVQHISSLVGKEFEGYPTSTQLNTECPKMQDFKTCIEPIRVKCAQMSSAEAQQINKGIASAVQLVDLVCGDELRADFVKFGKECFDKPAFKNVTKMCKMLDTPLTQPNAEPEPESKEEMCSRIKEEFNCYTEKLGLVCPEATVDFVKRVQDSFHNIIAEPLNCPLSVTGCSPQKMQVCVQHISSLAEKEFEGYPTSTQLNTECPKMQDFKTCIEPIRVKCAQMSSAEAQQINKGIASTVQLVDLVCGDELRADFVKFGKECFDKPAFKNVTKMCKMLDTPLTQPNAEPEPESKEEMCSRIKEEFNCYTEKLGPVCSEATVDFVKRVQGSFHNIIAEPLNCPLSGCSQLAVQTWMLLGILLAAFFLY